MATIDLEKRRLARLREYAIDQALERFEGDYPGFTPEPIVASLCAYEEEGNIAGVLAKMPETIDGQPYTVLVVVDGGEDRTAEIARSFPAARVIEFPVNLGHGVALQVTYRYCVDHDVKYVVTLDADGQNDPAEMHRLVALLVEDAADFVIASRQLGEDHTTDRFRRTGVAVYAHALNSITGQHLTDTSNGYRAFRIEVLKDIVPHLRQDQYQTAEVVITAATRGWRIGEVPITWHPRASGESKKGGNLFFGLQYARVIATTWARMSLANGRRR